MSTMQPYQHARYLEVLDAAQSLFDGDLESAGRWMSHPVKAFGGKSPASMAGTRVETDTVIEFVRRLEHGIVI